MKKAHPIYLDEELSLFVHELAKKQKRSFTQQVEFWIEGIFESSKNTSCCGSCAEGKKCESEEGAI